jgi:uncharacterized protein YbbC (DUF1343 family)
MMEACAAAGIQLVVLDRPNPLGGDMAMAEGPMLAMKKLLGQQSILTNVNPAWKKTIEPFLLYP